MSDIANLPAISALFDYAAAAPATDPGEGYWADIEAAFGCGERAAQYEAATKIRAALSALGLMTPNGVELCPGCSQPAASGDHDPDCEHADDADRITIPETAPRVITLDDLSPESRTDAIQAIVIGADQMRYTSGGGVEFLVGGEPIDPRGIADTTVLHIAGDQEWSVGQQRAAEAQGWAIVTRADDRDLHIVRLDRETFANDEHASQHVAEGARGGHAFSDDYVALCRAALALVEASAGNPDDVVDDTPALPSTPPSDGSALARAARAAGWELDYDGEQDTYLATAPEGATVTFGDWQALRDAPAGCIYEWRYAAGMETQPGFWMNNPSDGAVIGGAQCRVATLTFALPSPSASDTDALPLDPAALTDAVMRAAAGDDAAAEFETASGLTWSHGQQRAALEQGWCITEGDTAPYLRIEADTDGDRFIGPDMHSQAADHVGEGARGGHAFTDDYVALCRAALALVEASASNPDDGDEGQDVDTNPLPSRSDAQIVEQAEDLARRMATEVMGYDLGAVSIPLRTMTDPRMRMCWQMACLAMEELQATDVTNALAGIGE